MNDMSQGSGGLADDTPPVQLTDVTVDGAPIEGTLVVTPQPTLTQVSVKRGLQTLWQGVGVVVVMAMLTALANGLTAASWAEWLGTWRVWTYSGFQAMVTAAVAYFIRRYADGSGVASISTTVKK